MTQPSSASQQTVESSSSSTTSGRAERHTRSHTKTSNPQKTVTPRSRGSDELSAARPEQAQGRRPKRKRGGGEDVAADPAPELAVAAVNAEAEEEAHDDESDEDDEEVTRCVCGQLEYPGPPFPVSTQHDRGLQDDPIPRSPVDSADPPPEEPGSLFIQCDTCKVWQHGGCVGIMDVSMSPDEYFCEQCRRDFHSIALGPKGQRWSRYLPVVGPVSSKASPTSSHPRETEMKSSRSKTAAQNSLAQSSKRRSTMNSRDAAYDEEEQLRQAIEESKAAKMAGLRQDGKRSSSDSQDGPASTLKRPRTTSRSAASGSPPNAQHREQSQADDDTTGNRGGAPKRGRAAAARQQQENELRELEAQRTREKAEAAGRRKGRADRRRAEESEAPSEPPMSRTGGAMSPPASTTRSVEARATPRSGKNASTNAQASAAATATTTAPRKTTRPQARRGRLGRNQYTRDRDLARDAANGMREPSAARTESRDGPGKDDARNGLNGESSKPSRPRHMNPNRTTMNDMRRRAAAILEFISRVQVEMATEKTPAAAVGSSAPPKTTTATTKTAAATSGPVGKTDGAVDTGGDVPKITLTGGEEKAGPATTEPAAEASGSGSGNQTQTDAAKTEERKFTDLSTVEMMDVLTRNIVLWQQEYGKWGDK